MPEQIWGPFKNIKKSGKKFWFIPRAKTYKMKLKNLENPRKKAMKNSKNK